MASCDNNVYINIKDLPQIFNIADGNFLVVENEQGTNIIDFKDIIISPEQTTFSTSLTSLRSSVTTLSTDLKAVSNIALPSIMNIRLSLDANVPATIRESIEASNTLYVHPFKGNTVTLYDVSLSAWRVYDFSSVLGISLASICNLSNTNYDIYLNRINDTFKISSRVWSYQQPGYNNFTHPDETTYIDGIALHPTDLSKRLIGCVRTTNPGISEYSYGNTAGPGISGSHPKLFIWNMYNREPVPFSIIDNRGQGGTWSTTTLGQNASANGPFEKFGGTIDNRVSFISREPVTLNLNSTHFVVGNSLSSFYFAYALNLETPTVGQLLTNMPGIPILEDKPNQALTHSCSLRILPGYNFIQLVSMTYPIVSNDPVKFEMWGNDRKSYGTVGMIQDI